MIEITTAQVALVGALVGPLLTYAGVRYQQRDKLETIARQIVEETLRRQQAEIETLRSERDKDRQLAERLRRAFVGLREGLVSVTEQTRRIRDRFDVYFEVRGYNRKREEEAIDAIDQGFDDLLKTLEGLAEATDPLSSSPGKRAEAAGGE